MSYHSSSHETTSHHTASHHTIQHHITPCDTTSHHAIPYHTIEHQVTSQDTASHFTSCSIIPSPCGMTPMHTIPYHTALHYILCTTSHHTSYYTTPHHKIYPKPYHATCHNTASHHIVFFIQTIQPGSWYYIVLSLISKFHGIYYDSDICVSCLCISESMHEVKKKLIKYWRLQYLTLYRRDAQLNKQHCEKIYQKTNKRPSLRPGTCGQIGCCDCCGGAKVIHDYL